MVSFAVPYRDGSESPTLSRNENQLVARYLGGEQAAWGALYLAYFDEVARRIRGRGIDLHTSQDLAQVALEKARTAIDTFDQERSFGPWLFTIAQRVATDWQRRSPLRHERSFVMPNGASGYFEADLSQTNLPSCRVEAGALDTLEMNEERLILEERVHSTLSRMNDKHREILQLAARGVTYGEMADYLEIRVGTVKSRLFSARNEFKTQWLEAYGVPPPEYTEKKSAPPSRAIRPL